MCCFSSKLNLLIHIFYSISFHKKSKTRYIRIFSHRLLKTCWHKFYMKNTQLQKGLIFHINMYENTNCPCYNIIWGYKIFYFIAFFKISSFSTTIQIEINTFYYLLFGCLLWVYERVSLRLNLIAFRRSLVFCNLTVF